MAGAFQESGFQYTGFQMDPAVAEPPGPVPPTGGIVQFLMARPMRYVRDTRLPLSPETLAEIGKVAESADPDLELLLAEIDRLQRAGAQAVFEAYRREVIRKRRITAAYLLAAAS